MRRERAQTEILLYASKTLSLSSTQIANGILITNLPPEFEKKELFNFFRKAGSIDYFICCKNQVIFIFANAFGKECAGIYDRIRFGSSEIEIVLQDLDARDLQNMGTDFEKVDVGMFREEEENVPYGKRIIEEGRQKSILYKEGEKCAEEEGGREESGREKWERGEKVRVRRESIGKGREEGKEKEKEGIVSVGGKQCEEKEKGQGRRFEQKDQGGSGEEKKALEFDGRWEKEGEKRGIDGRDVMNPRSVNNDQNILRKHSMKKMKKIDLSIIEESDFPNNESIFSQQEIILSQRKSSLSKTFPNCSSTEEASFNKISPDSTDFSKIIQNIDTNLTKKRAISQQFQKQKNNLSLDNPSCFQQKDPLKNLNDETHNDNDNFNQLNQNTDLPIDNQSFKTPKKSMKSLNDEAQNDYKNWNKTSQNEILSIDHPDFFPKRKHSIKQKNDFLNEDSVDSNPEINFFPKKSQNYKNNKENIDPLQPNQSEEFQLLNDSFMENEEKDENRYLYLEEGDEEILKTCNFNEVEDKSLFSEGRDRLLFDVEEEDQEKVFHTLKIKENSLKKVYLHQDIFRDNVINVKYARKMFVLWIWAYGMYTIVCLIQKLFKF